MNKNNITALLDADSIMWILAYKHADDTNSLALVQHIDEFITDILNSVKATQYAGFVGGTEKNFRFQLATHKPYKGNRPPKPEFMVKWEGIIKHHMISKWGFIECGLVEADDAVSICANLLPKDDNPIVCHIDKDIDQVPGNHYNYQKRTFYHITEEQAWRHKLLLALTGDGTDNIAGLPGVGPAKAHKYLVGTTYEECVQSVEDGFIKYYAEYYGKLIFNETISLVSTLTEEDYGFKMPEFTPWGDKTTEETVAEIDFSLFD